MQTIKPYKEVSIVLRTAGPRPNPRLPVARSLGQVPFERSHGDLWHLHKKTRSQSHSLNNLEEPLAQIEPKTVSNLKSIIIKKSNTELRLSLASK